MISCGVQKKYKKKSIILTNNPTLCKWFWLKKKKTRHSYQICSIRIKYLFLGPRDLGKYKSSEWLLDKLTICWKLEVLWTLSFLPSKWDYWKNRRLNKISDFLNDIRNFHICDWEPKKCRCCFLKCFKILSFQSIGPLGRCFL